MQFKDIDGDRRADYIVVDQLDGHIIAFRNLGPKPGGWGWTAMNDGKKIADGIGAAGADVLWGRLEKTNRYSYVGVSPNSGALRSVQYSTCYLPSSLPVTNTSWQTEHTKTDVPSSLLPRILQAQAKAAPAAATRAAVQIAVRAADQAVLQATMVQVVMAQE